MKKILADKVDTLTLGHPVFTHPARPVRFVDCLSLCGFFDFRLLILCNDMVWTVWYSINDDEMTSASYYEISNQSRPRLNIRWLF